MENPNELAPSETNLERNVALHLAGGPEPRRARTLVVAAVAAGCLSVLLALTVALLTITQSSQREDRANERIGNLNGLVLTLQDQLSCRSSASIRADIAKLEGFESVLVGLELLVDRNQDGVADQPEYQQTLNQMTKAREDQTKARDAREDDLAAIADDECPR